MNKEKRKWKRSNDKKSKVLEMKHGTAAARLRKDIMFNLVQIAGMDTCFRCGKKIETIKEFSIDHKVDWLNHENPIEMFFDLDNIAFSHYKCNLMCVTPKNKKIAPPGKSWCWKCKRYRDVKKFSKDKTRWTGLNHACKECRRDLYQETGH